MSEAKTFEPVEVVVGGLTFKVGSNTKKRDHFREMLRVDAANYLGALAGAGKLPFEIAVSQDMVWPVYQDVISSLIDINGDPKHPMMIELLLVSTFDEWSWKITEEEGSEPLRKLWSAAMSLNPQWYPVQPLTELNDEESEAARELVDKSLELLDPTKDQRGKPDEYDVADAVISLKERRKKKSEEDGKDFLPPKK